MTRMGGAGKMHLSGLWDLEKVWGNDMKKYLTLALAGAAANSASARIGSVKARFILLAPV